MGCLELKTCTSSPPSAARRDQVWLHVLDPPVLHVDSITEPLLLQRLQAWHQNYTQTSCSQIVLKWINWSKSNHITRVCVWACSSALTRVVMLFVCRRIQGCGGLGGGYLTGGVVVNMVSLLQCRLSVLSYLFLWHRTGHLICPRYTQLIGPPLQYQVSPVCLDTPALWLRQVFLYVSWHLGWLQATPADRLHQWQRMEWFTVQIMPSFNSRK